MIYYDIFALFPDWHLYGYLVMLNTGNIMQTNKSSKLNIRPCLPKQAIEVFSELLPLSENKIICPYLLNVLQILENK